MCKQEGTTENAMQFIPLNIKQFPVLRLNIHGDSNHISSPFEKKIDFPAHPMSLPTHLAGGYIHVAKKIAGKKHF